MYIQFPMYIQCVYSMTYSILIYIYIYIYIKMLIKMQPLSLS